MTSWSLSTVTEIFALTVSVASWGFGMLSAIVTSGGFYVLLHLLEAGNKAWILSKEYLVKI